MYKDVVNNEAVTALGNWHKTIYQNEDNKSCNEEEYLTRTIENTPTLMGKFEEIFTDI